MHWKGELKSDFHFLKTGLSRDWNLQGAGELELQVQIH
jgi:hypothetical protein